MHSKDLYFIVGINMVVFAKLAVGAIIKKDLAVKNISLYNSEIKKSIKVRTISLARVG